MMTAEPKPRMTYAEYLALERVSEVKHEFLRGEVWAMAGGTPSHAKIQANLIGALTVALKGRPCAPYTSDLRVRVESSNRSTYPDISVICGKRQAANDDPDAVTNPTVLIEVLSESSEASDRGEKFAHYRRLESLQEYVLVSQSSRQVEVFRRGEGISWTLYPCRDGDAVELKSIDVNLDFADIYADPNA